jgi:hypothetical protein
MSVGGSTASPAASVLASVSSEGSPDNCSEVREVLPLFLTLWLLTLYHAMLQYRGRGPVGESRVVTRSRSCAVNEGLADGQHNRKSNCGRKPKNRQP